MSTAATLTTLPSSIERKGPTITPTCAARDSPRPAAAGQAGAAGADGAVDVEAVTAVAIGDTSSCGPPTPAAAHGLRARRSRSAVGPPAPLRPVVRAPDTQPSTIEDRSRASWPG